MRSNQKRCVSVLLSGTLLCMAGCSSSTQTEPTDTAGITELPPLVTTASQTQLSIEETAAETTEPVLEEPLFQSELVSWELPETLGSLKAVRTREDVVYLLGIQQDDTQQLTGQLYYASATDEPTFALLYPSANEADFVGLTDFDVLSDGTICGLICENTNTIPYDDPEFDPETFDWDAYYENYATQYRLVWYNESGCVTQSLWLSTLLELDQTARQTMAFTGVRCDTSGQIYLTATIDDQEYLMALDDNENLCMIQGSSSKMLALESGYQWLRCADEGMLLLERDAETDEMALYHIVVTDDALWKTQVDTPQHLTFDTVAAEDTQETGWFGFWNEIGIYRIADKNAEPQLLYHWDDLHLHAADVAQALLLSDSRVLLASYSAQSALALSLVKPVKAETETKPSTTPTSPQPEQPAGNDSPPIATPLTTMTSVQE